MAFFFIISLFLPSFGGDIEVRISAKTLEGCWGMNRAAAQMIRESGVKAHVGNCEKAN